MIQEAIDINEEINHNITAIEIQDFINNLNFPMIIEDNDDDNPAMHLFYNDFTQFYGLDRLIWPFMENWEDDFISNIKLNRNTQSKSNNKQDTYEETSLGLKEQWQLIPHLIEQNEVDNNSLYDLIFEKIVTICKPSDNNRKEQCNWQSPDEFKSEMLDLWYKKHNLQAPKVDKFTSIEANERKWLSKVKGDSNTTWLLLHDETTTDPDLLEEEDGAIKQPNFILTLPHSSNKVQTQFNEPTETVTIPGFDAKPPTLELNVLKSHQVAIKGVDDVTVQFDVINNMDEGSKMTCSFVCVPVTANGRRQTNVLKCTQIIRNETLPAELCHITSKLLQDKVLS